MMRRSEKRNEEHGVRTCLALLSLGFGVGICHGYTIAYCRLVGHGVFIRRFPCTRIMGSGSLSANPFATDQR
jgi:hypothetical protein